MLRIIESALKHGCTREEISHAYDLYLYEGVINEGTDPPSWLTLGPDNSGNLLELVGGEVQDDVVIWHAMPCTRKYLRLLPEQGDDQ